ncbi:hypothetical protein M5K25_000270 [Dendrobium thyrsiflorum]|uniref:Uncharacterized protein n=1 Tax=Dendrobium thyrsiflorum TaxID=117978 RepID=A0ABD0WA46_DENTH
MRYSSQFSVLRISFSEEPLYKAFYGSRRFTRRFSSTFPRRRNSFQTWSWKKAPQMAYHLEKLCCWELWHPAPTWAVLKITFMMLSFCLIAMLSLAFISSDFIIVGHVILLVIIGAVLFVLLNGFLAQTGLVSVEQQIEEMGISQNDRHLKDKKK